MRPSAGTAHFGDDDLADALVAIHPIVGDDPLGSSPLKDATGTAMSPRHFAGAPELI